MIETMYASPWWTLFYLFMICTAIAYMGPFVVFRKHTVQKKDSDQ